MLGLECMNEKFDCLLYKEAGRSCVSIVRLTIRKKNVNCLCEKPLT